MFFCKTCTHVTLQVLAVKVNHNPNNKVTVCQCPRILGFRHQEVLYIILSLSVTPQSLFPEELASLKSWRKLKLLCDEFRQGQQTKP